MSGQESNLISKDIKNEEELSKYFQGLISEKHPDPYSDTEEIFRNHEDSNKAIKYEISENTSNHTPMKIKQDETLIPAPPSSSEEEEIGYNEGYGIILCR